GCAALHDRAHRAGAHCARQRLPLPAGRAPSGRADRIHGPRCTHARSPAAWRRAGMARPRQGTLPVTRIRIEIGGETVSADLSAPLDLSIPLAFDGPQPNCFGAPRATRETLTVGDWKGDTRQGGSCNVGVYRLVPHCNGTHTECIGHVSDDETFAADIVRGGLFPATLISVTPQPFAQCDETGTEGTQPGDLVITRATLAMAFERFSKVAMRKALAIRTLPNDPAKRTYQYDAATPPAYLSVEAASLLVENGVEHLLVDVPSIDRMDDGGRLRAHRVFFGLP